MGMPFDESGLDEDREHLPFPDLTDDEDGYPWDCDRGGSLGNDDDGDDDDDGT